MRGTPWQAGNLRRFRFWRKGEGGKGRGGGGEGWEGEPSSKLFQKQWPDGINHSATGVHQYGSNNLLLGSVGVGV